MKLRDYKNVKERRIAVEKLCRVDLTNTGSFTLDEAVTSGRHCENMIGVTQVPVGIAGPLTIKHEHENVITKEYYIPLATTEGALVASVNRGCLAITRSGGATVDSVRIGASRGPVFRVENIRQGNALTHFLETHFEKLKKVAAQTSHHLTLTSYTLQGTGKHRFVRFVFDTQDAMGLNMVTIATDALTTYIREKTEIECVSLSGNYCVDKKPSWLNIVNKRGAAVWAEVVIPKSVLASVLKTTADALYRVWLAKCMVGSAMSGSMAFNAQYANIISAVFLATGQDIAHVVEGSLGITTAEVVDAEDLYISVYLPDLMVGTVGGGTGLATQKEALTILGVAGGGGGENSKRFAEIIAGAALAGEVSLLSSLSEGSLVKAHRRLGRGEHI